MYLSSQYKGIEEAKEYKQIAEKAISFGKQLMDKWLDESYSEI